MIVPTETVEKLARILRRERLIATGAGPVFLVFNDDAPAEEHDIAAVRAVLAALTAEGVALARA